MTYAPATQYACDRGVNFFGEVCRGDGTDHELNPYMGFEWVVKISLEITSLESMEIAGKSDEVFDVAMLDSVKDGIALLLVAVPLVEIDVDAGALPIARASARGPFPLSGYAEPALI
jgi:hypothetical protein